MRGTLSQQPRRSTRIRATATQPMQPSQNGSRYAGRKRTHAASHSNNNNNSDSDSDSDDEDDDEDTESDAAANIASSRHHNQRNDNRNRNRTQTANNVSQLATQSQSQSTQAQAQRHPDLRYKHDPTKWTQKQSNLERRSTRLKYRKLADETHENRAQIADPMSGLFMDKLVEQAQLYSHVHHPNEAFLDIQQTNAMSKICVEQTSNLRNEEFTITPAEYIKTLIHKFSMAGHGEEDDDEDENAPAQIDWDAVGESFAPWFLTVPSIQFLNGPLQHSGGKLPEEQKKQRQIRAKKKFAIDAPVVQPKKIVKQKKQDKTETKSRVTHLQKVLRKKCESQQGVNAFEFLINPSSYSQTIENLFDMSFIMKEGVAQMDVEETTQQPIISYVSNAEKTRRHEAQTRTSKSNNGQCIVKFNPATFCDLVDVYNIRESQIERADAGIASDGEVEEEGGENDEDDADGESEDEETSSQDEDDDDDDDDEEEGSDNSNDGARKPHMRGRGRGRGRGSGANGKEEAD